MFALALIAAASLALLPETVKDAFGGLDGALVILDPSGKTILRHGGSRCDEKLPPCSTFKIWNTAIGLELGLVSDPDAPFWNWDGQKYGSIPGIEIKPFAAHWQSPAFPLTRRSPVRSVESE